MLADSAYMLVFRIVHITAGVLWVESVFLLSVFVAPAAEAIAPAGAPLMGELLGKRRLVDRIIGLGAITVVGGLFLYWHDWHLFPSFGDWLSSRFGGTLTIGMVAALVALGLGGRTRARPCAACSRSARRWRRPAHRPRRRSRLRSGRCSGA